MIARNNVVDCSNALCFALQADVIYIENNDIKCYAGVIAKNNLKNNIKLNSDIVIKNNILDLSHYNNKESLPPENWRSGINIESNYGSGESTKILNNKIRIRSVDNDNKIRRPIKVLNVPYVSFCNNVIDTDILSDRHIDRLGILECVAYSSKTVPLDFRTFEKIEVSRNRIVSGLPVMLLDIVNESVFESVNVNTLNMIHNDSAMPINSYAKDCVIDLLNLETSDHSFFKTKVSGLF